MQLKLILVFAIISINLVEPLNHINEILSLKSNEWGDNKPRAGSYSKAAVATEVAICSKLGAETLKRGGNAVDAAVVSALCIGVTNVQRFLGIP